jgi:DNA end-binding protein Ku
MNDAFPPDTRDTLPFTGMTPYGRPSWSGLLQFSLVGIPLKAYPAVRTRDVPTAHLLHADCGQRLRYAKHCPVHGPIDAAAIVRGYEYGPGQHVVAQPDELDRLRPAQDKALRLERFLAPGQLDPLLFAGRSLYLVPDGKAAEPGYGLTRTTRVSTTPPWTPWPRPSANSGSASRSSWTRPASSSSAIPATRQP